MEIKRKTVVRYHFVSLKTSNYLKVLHPEYPKFSQLPNVASDGCVRLIVFQVRFCVELYRINIYIEYTFLNEKFDNLTLIYVRRRFEKLMFVIIIIQISSQKLYIFNKP
jgi:hypothetical protein